MYKTFLLKCEYNAPEIILTDSVITHQAHTVCVNMKLKTKISIYYIFSEQ